MLSHLNTSVQTEGLPFSGNRVSTSSPRLDLLSLTGVTALHATLGAYEITLSFLTRAAHSLRYSDFILFRLALK